jgi:hypothetical protein
MKMMMSLYFDNSVLGLPEYSFNIQAAAVSFIAFAVLYELFMFVYAKRIRCIPLKEVMQEE